MSGKATGPGSDEDFVYETDAGGSITLPSMARIKAGVIRKIRKLSEVDQMFTIIEELADADSLAAFDVMDGDELAAFASAWEAHSGTSLGESGAS